MESEPLFVDKKDLEFEHSVIRTYSRNEEATEFKWNKNEEDQVVDPLHINDWKILFEHMLPQKMNQRFFIRKGEQYKFVQGTRTLKVRIMKLIK